MPKPLALLQAGLMELMPGPTLMSRDNVRSLGVDNVAPLDTTTCHGLADLDIQPRSIHALAAHHHR
jgi:hypothetical protein